MTPDALLARVNTDLGPVELYRVAGRYAIRGEYVRADTGQVVVTAIPVDIESARRWWERSAERGIVYGGRP